MINFSTLSFFIFTISYIFSAIKLIAIGQDKKQMKNILQRDNQKRDKKTQPSTYLTALSNKTIAKTGRGVDAGGMIEYIYI